MWILAIDTTGPLGSVALINQEGKAEMEVSDKEMNHLKDLMPMAQRLIEKCMISKKDISAVSVSVGPGSFTGIRIGVSSGRALAQAWEIPCISVPTLDMFRQKCENGNTVAVIFNARRGQVYGGVFDEAGQDILSPGPYMLTDVLEAVKPHDNVIFYGDGIDAYQDRLNGYTAATKEDRYQTAEMVAKDALKKYNNGEKIGVEELLPNYMRMAEAEQKLKSGALEKERKAKCQSC